MATSTTKTSQITVMDAADVEVAPRGRKVESDPVLVKAFAALKDDQALRLDMFGSVAKDDRAKVGQTIRKNWKVARGEASRCTIDYGTTGVPQVRVKTAAPAE